MKNMRRAANRRGGVEPGHNDMAFRPSNTDHSNFGTPASRGRVGSGTVAGAGELQGSWGTPGKLGRRLSGMAPDMFPSEVASTDVPKGMDVIAEGEGPGHKRHNG